MGADLDRDYLLQESKQLAVVVVDIDGIADYLLIPLKRGRNEGRKISIINHFVKSQ